MRRWKWEGVDRMMIGNQNLAEAEVMPWHQLRFDLLKTSRGNDDFKTSLSRTGLHPLTWQLCNQ